MISRSWNRELAAKNLTRLTDRFQDALSLAFRLHDGQKRKGTQVPYFSHLMGVAALVLEDGGNEDDVTKEEPDDSDDDDGGTGDLEADKAEGSLDTTR